MRVAEEAAENGRVRPVRNQLLANFDRGDEIVVLETQQRCAW